MTSSPSKGTDLINADISASADMSSRRFRQRPASPVKIDPGQTHILVSFSHLTLLATSFLALSLGPVGVVLATHPDTLEVQTQNGIDYVAGGIGKEQAEAMKVAAHDYDLMLTFATDGGKYLADIDLQIENMNGNTLLNTVSEGPLFLANLPVGRYKITASAQGKSHTTIVDIGREHPAKAVFQWPGYAMD